MKRKRVPLGRQLSLASQDADDHLTSMKTHLSELQLQVASDKSQIQHGLNAQQLRQMQSTMKGRQHVIRSLLQAIDIVDDVKDSLHSGRQTAEATYKSLKIEGDKLQKSLAKLMDEVAEQEKIETRKENEGGGGDSGKGVCEDLHQQTINLLRGRSKSASKTAESTPARSPRTATKVSSKNRVSSNNKMARFQAKRQSARIANRAR
jgi:hypothetical protein